MKPQVLTGEATFSSKHTRRTLNSKTRVRQIARFNQSYRITHYTTVRRPESGLFLKTDSIANIQLRP